MELGAREGNFPHGHDSAVEITGAISCEDVAGCWAVRAEARGTTGV